MTLSESPDENRATVPSDPSRRLTRAVLVVRLVFLLAGVWAGAASAQPFAYIPNSSDNNVSVIDTATNTVIGSPVPVGSFPFGVAVNPARTRVYVTNASDDTISVIDTVTNTVIGSPVPVGAYPQGVAVNRAGTRVYVANQSGDTVSVIDATTNAVIGTPVPVECATGVAVNPAGTRVYVSNVNNDTVSVIDATTNTVGSPVLVGGSPFAFGIFIPPAAPATHFTMSAPASATAGNAFSFTITALDQFNEVDTSYTGIVHFTSSDGAATLPADATLTNGTGTFSATLKTAGNQTTTGTDTVTASITGTSNTIAVSAAAATHFTVSAPASATAGTAFSFTVTALDQFNNTATGYAGTVHFTSSNATATLPANSTLTNGVGAFSANLVIAGNQTITATDTTTSSIAGTSNTIVVNFANLTLTYSAPSPTGTGTITVVLTMLNQPSCQLTRTQFIPLTGNPFSPPAGSAPAGIVFPHGLFDFRLEGCVSSAGSPLTVNFTVTYPAALAAGTQYRKYGPTPGNATPHWYILPATITGNTAAFAITDGQLGDDSLAVYGDITDQGGPGSPAPTQIPTLQDWALVLLGLMLAAGSIRRLRRAAGESTLPTQYS